MLLIPWLRRWWRSKPRHRKDPFVLATHGDLDIVMPPPYELSAARQEEAKALVEGLIRRLQPNGLDAGSREVLHNFINDWADHSLAELAAERDERQAVGEILIGLARQEVIRRKPRYDGDFTRAAHASTALAVTFEELTGRKAGEYVAPKPERIEEGPLRSVLGPVDLNDHWGPVAANNGQGAQR